MEVHVRCVDGACNKQYIQETGCVKECGGGLSGVDLGPCLCVWPIVIKVHGHTAHSEKILFANEVKGASTLSEVCLELRQLNSY